MFLLFEKRDGGRDVRWLLLSVWTMMEKREKWTEGCVESTGGLWESWRDDHQGMWESYCEAMVENDDCVVDGTSEYQKERIICWDCQTPQVQERSDCFHWEKNMEKQFLKHLNRNNKLGETVERVKQLRKEMCDVVSREILSNNKRAWRKVWRSRKGIEISEECVLVKYVWWKGNKLVVINVKS